KRTHVDTKNCWKALPFKSQIGFAGLAALLVFGGLPPANGEDLGHALKSWIAGSIRVVNDKDGRPQLFVRTQSVVVDIRSEIPSIVPEVRAAIAAFSDAFQLQYGFSRNNPNLF